MIRIAKKDYSQDGRYWADDIAERLIRKNPERETYVCACGISPSGSVHFGNLREVITAYAVLEALQRRGKNTRFIYSWDDFDRLRKIPKGVGSHYEEHLGKALSDIPSPTNRQESYAATREREFEEALRALNLRPTYRYQTEQYRSGAYDDAIIEALQKREAIADIVLSFMTEKGKRKQGITDAAYRAAYFPIAVYSRFSQKDATTILSYDGEKTIRYRCDITKKEDEVDITKHRIVKLSWKVDWAMRWRHEGVCFEPGGSDHAAPGGSYDVAAAIAEKVFQFEPPVFAEYGFVGTQGLGTKMSGSSGQGVLPNDLLAIYEPTMLLWMYLRRLPTQTFSLAFDTEVYRQYDEWDFALTRRQWWRNLVLALRDRRWRQILRLPARLPSDRRVCGVLRALFPDAMHRRPIPFRQIVGLAQTVRWDEEKLHELLNAARLRYDAPSVSSRLPRAKTWVLKHNKGAALLIRETPNIDAWKEADEECRGYVRDLRAYIKKNGTKDISRLETYLYALPKKRYREESELKKAQRAFFKHVYRLILGQPSGPRLSTLLWALPKEKVLALLNPS